MNIILKTEEGDMLTCVNNYECLVFFKHSICKHHNAFWKKVIFAERVTKAERGKKPSPELHCELLGKLELEIISFLFHAFVALIETVIHTSTVASFNI